MSLEKHDREEDPLEWARAKAGLGRVLVALAERRAATVQVGEAAALYEAALAVFDEACAYHDATSARRGHFRVGELVGRGNGMDEANTGVKTERMLQRRLDRAERLLPGSFGRWVAHLRQPSASWVRVPLGVVLVLGGLLGFLPVLGFWMVPLGLLLLALDVALLRRPTASMLVGGERLWGRLRRTWRTG